MPKNYCNGYKDVSKNNYLLPRQSNVRVMFQILTSLSSLLSISQSDFMQAYSLVPNVTHRSIETRACTLGESIGLNYPHT